MGNNDYLNRPSITDRELQDVWDHLSDRLQHVADTVRMAQVVMHGLCDEVADPERGEMLRELSREWHQISRQFLRSADIISDSIDYECDAERSRRREAQRLRRQARLGLPDRSA